jgi:hypothetical protein
LDINTVTVGDNGPPHILLASMFVIPRKLLVRPFSELASLVEDQIKPLTLSRAKIASLRTVVICPKIAPLVHGHGAVRSAHLRGYGIMVLSPDRLLKVVCVGMHMHMSVATRHKEQASEAKQSLSHLSALR